MDAATEELNAKEAELNAVTNKWAAEVQVRGNLQPTKGTWKFQKTALNARGALPCESYDTALLIRLSRVWNDATRG